MQALCHPRRATLPSLTANQPPMTPPFRPLSRRVLQALRDSRKPLDAYGLSALVDASVMEVGRALAELEAQERVRSNDPEGTANDLARCFTFVREYPRAWYEEKNDRPAFEFEGCWWFIAVEGFSIPQVRGPFESREATLRAWTQFWEFQEAMDAN